MASGVSAAERKLSPDNRGAGPEIRSGGNDEISLLKALAVVGERKRFISLFTFCIAAVSVGVSFLLPKSYTATATLLPPQQNSSLSSVLSSQLGSLGGGMAALAGGSLGLKNPNETFVAMLRSRTLEDAMIKKFSLMDEYHKKYQSDARKALEDRVTVDGTNKDGLIHISVEDHNPQRAAELANGYVDEFRNLSEHLAITEASQRRLFFERQLDSAKDNLAAAEEELKKTQQKTGVIELTGQSRALIESATSLRAQIAAREVQIQGMSTYATGQNPQLIQAQQELDGLRAQLAKLGGSEDIGSAGLIVPKGQVPEAGLEYVRKVRNVRYYETIFEILAKQFEIAKLDEAKEGSLIQVVDTAVPPDKKSFPKRGLIVIVSTLVALVISLLIVLWKASMEHLRDDPETSLELTRIRKAFSLRNS